MSNARAFCLFVECERLLSLLRELVQCTKVEQSCELFY